MLTSATDETIHLGQQQDSKNQNKTCQSDTHAITTNVTGCSVSRRKSLVAKEQAALGMSTDGHHYPHLKGKRANKK
jgi:hypothetical protein